MVDYNGIDIVAKPKLTKVVHAIAVGDLAELYGAVRDADETFRQNFLNFLALNNLRGRTQASRFLQQVTDPLSAVRAAAVCLLTMAIDGRREDG